MMMICSVQDTLWLDPSPRLLLAASSRNVFEAVWRRTTSQCSDVLWLFLLVGCRWPQSEHQRCFLDIFLCVFTLPAALQVWLRCPSDPSQLWWGRVHPSDPWEANGSGDQSFRPGDDLWAGICHWWEKSSSLSKNLLPLSKYDTCLRENDPPLPVYCSSDTVVILCAWRRSIM